MQIPTILFVAMTSQTGFDWPLAITLTSSVVVGLGMVVLFGYTSNQKAIKRAKVQIQANLLAVRLFQDQLGAVLRAYVGILTSLGRYLKLSFAPLLLVILPLTLLLIQMDRFLGWMPLPADQPFLVTARFASADALNDARLQSASGDEILADAVHMPGTNQIVWRVPAPSPGKQNLLVSAFGRSEAKQIVVGSRRLVARLSPVRMQGPWWKRLLESGEPAIEAGAEVQSIEVSYPVREISVFGFRLNWMLWFFVFSMIAGYIFKRLLGIEI